jgi:uncharacterized cupin superfamily protein
MSHTLSHLLDWSELPEAEATQPAPGRVLEPGPVPRQSVSNLHSSPDGRFHVGEWSSGVGAWRIAYTETELCHLLEGVIRLRDNAGQAKTYRAGDSFVITSGFTGTWEVLEPCRKLYAIYE